MGTSLRIGVSEGESLDPRGFCSQTRVVIVAGKGGVGKTTVAATLARLASSCGLSVLVLDVDGRRPAPAGGHPSVRFRTITPDTALVEYLEEHGLRRVSRRLVRSGAVDIVSTAAPGIKDILLLGKVKQLERQGAADLIVVDTPAAGHAVALLANARAVLDMVHGGPLRTQAEEVLEMLTDPRRCQVMLVTLPEETPVNEAVETAFAVEDRVGADLGPVVVNSVYPVLEGLDVDPEEAAREHGLELEAGEAGRLRSAARFRAGRQALQQEQIARLSAALPLPQIRLPCLFTVELAEAEIDTLAGAMAAGVAVLPEGVAR